MKNIRSKNWIAGFLILAIIPLIAVACFVVYFDPYFHYHQPYTSAYFYSLYHQRSQNDGISRNFDYEGMITGTSMTENFKTSDAELFFGVDFVKVPYSGATFNEINNNIEVALRHNKNITIIIRGLDMDRMIMDKDAMRYDLGDYPDYLYNENPFDDVNYLFNRDVIFNKVYGMATEPEYEGFEPGMTSFDEYSNWMSDYTFGVNALFPEGIAATDRSTHMEPLSDDEKEILIGNIRQNVTDIAEQYPDVTFYCFFTPYSAAWWQERINDGTFEKQLAVEQLVIEELLKADNIKLFSFNDHIEITSDLNNYRDRMHYAEWINSLMLRYMKDGEGLLTVGNYREYLSAERELYLNFDYEGCFESQTDYEDDLNYAELFHDSIYGGYES